MTGGHGGFLDIVMPEAEMVPGMRKKYVDKAIYFMLADAANGDTGFRLVGRNIFRPGVNRPKPDEFMADCGVVESIMEGRRCA